MSRSFYLSLELVASKGACLPAQLWWKRKYGTGHVVVTRAVAEDISKHGYAEWVVNRMKLSREQQARCAAANQAYFDTPCGSAAERAAERNIESVLVDLMVEGPGGDA